MNSETANTNSTHTSNNNYYCDSNSVALSDARFACNICFEPVSDEPVVTSCGHLYCWRCLYLWLEPGLDNIERTRWLSLPPSPYPPDRTRRVCPVCKAHCSVQSIVPVYVRAPSSATTSAAAASSLPTATTTTATATLTHNTNSNSDNQQLPPAARSARPKEDDSENDTNHDAETEQEMNNDFSISSHQSHNSFMEYENSTTNNTGMRRRRPVPGTSHSTINSMEQVDDTTTTTETVRPAVPRRPQASPSPSTVLPSSDPQQQQQQSEQPQTHFAPTTTTSSSSPSLPHAASLSQGMMPLVQSALRRAAGAAGSSHSVGGGVEFVPPLHNHRLDRGPLYAPEMVSGGNPYYPADIAEDPGATEFLQKLLLLLGSVVLFCLLIF